MQDIVIMVFSVAVAVAVIIHGIEIHLLNKRINRLVYHNQLCEKKRR